MKTLNNTLRRRVRPRPCGFTLIELMVVIMIIILLVGILMPSLAGARIQMLRTSCLNNVRRLAEGCQAYAHDGSLSRGNDVLNQPCTPNALPSTGPTAATWYKGDTGNAAALWLMIKREFVAPTNLLCPEAELRRDFRLLNETELQGANCPFTQATCSYAYLSQVPFTVTVGGISTTYSATSLIDVNAYLVVVADDNPRTTMGSAAFDAAQNAKNSLNHKQEGQNFARLDGSAEWTEKTTVFVKVDTGGTTINNDIYIGDGGDGMRNSLDDFFVIP